MQSKKAFTHSEFMLYTHLSIRCEGLLLRTLLLCICITCCKVSLLAQDSINVVSADSMPACNAHKLKAQTVVIPVVLTGVAALYIQDHGWFAHQKRNVQKALSAEGKHRTHVDEFLQFAPIATVWGLRFAGVKSKHTPKERIGIMALSFATMSALTYGTKLVVHETRPDGSDRRSFPSGHTARAFMGAEILYQEYKDVSPWIGYAGYAMAAATGYLRIYNDKHYINDVLAGACIGILSTKVGYWLYPKVFSKSKCAKQTAIFPVPFVAEGGAGISMSLVL